MKNPSIHVDGAILSPDILDSIEDLRGQSPTDFDLGQHIKVKDEIAQAWADAQDYWRIFQRKVERLGEGNNATTETRSQWIIPLLGLLHYEVKHRAKGENIDGQIYPISHLVSNRANTPLIIAGILDPAGLDKKPSTSQRRMSAHALMQEFLNLRDELYGIVTDGSRIRLLRDSSRLVKQSFLEFDLERIFSEGLFADFSVFYRILHSSRLPNQNENPSDCLLEQYHQDSLDSGARIRAGLSTAVKNAILDLGNGFLSNESNRVLRKQIEFGELTSGEFYQYLLRLIYRLLFLMVIEERNLVFPANTRKEESDVYYVYYSVSRLRRLSEKRSFSDSRKQDMWLALKACFLLFESDGPGKLVGISPLAGNLFSKDALGELANCSLENYVLLKCLNSLGVYRNPDSGQRIRVNYAALNVEEFGSVYEGLLEFEPVISPLEDQQIQKFSLNQGKERAATGSHYTPDDLVQPLIRYSIDYLIEICEQSNDPESALLDLKVADIACGSGHILLAAARRIAIKLAAIRTNEEQPSPEAYRTALRDVICNCIYGVDLNPLAVELCKVAFWLEAHSPGQPLNFLDHRIKCGDAIVGFSHRSEVDNGIPNEAFKTLPGDDQTVVALFRNKNRNDRKSSNQQSLTFTTELSEQFESVVQELRSVENLPENTSIEVELKKEKFESIGRREESEVLKTIANIPIAQFYIEKIPEHKADLIVDSEFRQYWSTNRIPRGAGPKTAIELSREKRFFHWFLEFPEVMEEGGFDCILGNPPYLGRRFLSRTFGHSFCECMKWIYAPAGSSDLVVYFLRRMNNLLKPGGHAAIITTNSIIDGQIRKDGLDQLVKEGSEINMAVRGTNWPGVANLIVSQLAFFKGEWVKQRYLDGKEVTEINSFFEENASQIDPKTIDENKNRLFQGYIFLGDGFLLTHEEAREICSVNPKNQDVIMPIMNGEELNSDPSQRPARSIINFWDWSIERAKEYPEPFAIVEKEVKPDRMKQNMKFRRNYWWRFGSPSTELTKSLQLLSSCFVAAQTTKYLNFTKLPTNCVYSNAINVLASERWDLFSVVQSTIHEIWARKYSGSLATRLRYSLSNCFIKFPFPLNLFDTTNRELAEIGETYHTHRKELMLSLQLGLTKIYNLFHNSQLTPELLMDASKCGDSEATAGFESVKIFRELHIKLDIAVRDAYGWGDLDLNHGFHELEFLPENDRMRFTIGTEARRELLHRLLEENLVRTSA